jgi:hypothetical protein
MNEKTKPIRCASALLVLDCSGSMNSHRKQTIQSVNSFLAGQKESDVETKITNVFFNDTVTRYDSKPVQEMPELSLDSYHVTDRPHYSMRSDIRLLVINRNRMS